MLRRTKILHIAFSHSVLIDGPDRINPIVWNMFTADPSAHVHFTCFQQCVRGFNMRDYHVFSSTDMEIWHVHGVILDDLPLAKE